MCGQGLSGAGGPRVAGPDPHWVSDYKELQAGRLPAGPWALASPVNGEQTGLDVAEGPL